MGEQVEVRIESRAMVRPAQPTAARHFFLSCLDIFWQDIHYNQRLLFYDRAAAPSGTTALLHQLKSSLALCLVHYYPWCGRIAKDPLPPHRLFLDCNDAGVEFVEASSHLPLSRLASGRFQMKPFFLELSQRPDHKGDSLYTSPLLSIQATLFSDGGLALGIAQSHVVADGQSLWDFMVSWGECSRGIPLSLLPLHNRERLAVPDPSPEKVKWIFPPETREEDKEEEEREAFVVEQNDKDSVSNSVEPLASLGDEGSSSMGTSSLLPDKPSSNASNVSSSSASAVGKLTSTGTDLHRDIPTSNVGNNPSANGAYANSKGEELAIQESKKNEVDTDDKLETVPPTITDKDRLHLNGDKESPGETKDSGGDEPNSNSLVQCLFDLPSTAVKKLKAEAGDGFTSFEVTCAHFWQRITIARQSPGCDPTYFAIPVNFRSRLTPPLPPAYFANVITFCLAQTTVGKVGSESLHTTASQIHKVIAQTQEENLVGFMHWLELRDCRVMQGGTSGPKGKGLNVASSPWFPAYRVDFGWGTPVAIRPVKAGGEGELVLFGGKPGSIQGDLEICTALPDSVLRRLLEDPEFLAKPPGSPYASL